MTSNVFRRGSLPSSDQNSNDVAAVIPDTMWLNHQREGRWEDHENQELNHLLQEAMIER